MNIAALEKMLARGRDDALLRFGLGDAYLRDGQANAAITHLRAAVEQKPEYSAAWKLLGKAYVEAAELEQALNSYKAGINAAEAAGDRQAAKEMTVFARRVQKSLAAT